MILFFNKRSTMFDQSCVWIQQIILVLALVTTICTAQPLQDRLPSLFDDFNYRAMHASERGVPLYSNRERRGHQHMTDAGYGSRVAAASKLASALIARDDLFGSFGPGRKKRNIPEDNDLNQRHQELDLEVPTL